MKFFILFALIGCALGIPTEVKEDISLVESNRVGVMSILGALPVSWFLVQTELYKDLLMCPVNKYQNGLEYNCVKNAIRIRQDKIFEECYKYNQSPCAVVSQWWSNLSLTNINTIYQELCHLNRFRETCGYCQY